MEKSANEKFNPHIRKPFYLLVCSFLFLFISALVYDFFTEESAPTETPIATDPALNDELPVLTRDVYLLSDTDLIDEELLKVTKRISISDSSDIETPSFFIADLEHINPEFDQVYMDLLLNKHAVLFIGKDLNAESVVSFFAVKQIPVVPIDGSMPTNFQAYGAMYSGKAGYEIPVFFATNQTDSFHTEGFVRALSNLEAHFETNAQ